MARVYNWQIGREMSYWYPEQRPKRQFAAVFDTNKCIACQTCTLACKTTWTSGKGQEYMLWNNVETKPYGFYPLAWDVNLLEKLGAQSWEGEKYAGRTVFEAAQAGERVLGWRPEEIDYANPNVGEDDCLNGVEKGAHFHNVHNSWFFYLARICNHCTYPACLSSCPRASIYKRPEDGIVVIDQTRCRGYQECVRACPYKKTFYNPLNGTSEKCIACFPKIELGIQPQCFVNCIGKIRFAGWISKPENAKAENPIDFLVHVKKVALPLFPQFGLEPNVYYIPPRNVPREFLLQMFGPNVDQALDTYRKAPEDKDLAGLLSLFGSTEKIVAKWKRVKEEVFGYDESNREIIKVPLLEAPTVRHAFDTARNVERSNIT
jgi:nitrate reductase beta subunit